MKALTARQASVLGFVIGHIVGTGFPPTFREIMDGLDMKALGSATWHLEALERKGFIKRGNSARSIRVLRDTFGREITLAFKKIGEPASGLAQIQLPPDQFTELERLAKNFDLSTNDCALGIVGNHLAYLEHKAEQQS